ncbi:MAG: tRNA pseudouridine(38-40) synthase TruA [Promethearchaeota archaeon]
MKDKKFLLKFYYIGAKKLYGSQRQPDKNTVEDIILEALLSKGYIDNVKASKFEVASRTDRNVSARANTFSCFFKKEPILMEINSALPKSIGVWAYTEVPENFLSRFNAKLRHYKYIVSTKYSILKKKFNFDISEAIKACEFLKGTHDFKNFYKKSKKIENTIRTIEDSKITIINDYVIIEFKSKAFLRQQVRRMVKKIIEFACGEINYDDFVGLFDPKNDISYQPAEPNGLILWDILFDDNINFKIDKKSIERMKDYFFEKMNYYGVKHQLFSILQEDDFC